LSRDRVVSSEASLREVLETVTKNSIQAVAVVDRDGRLAGLVTDGDIRRAILRGVSLEDRVGGAMNPTPTWAAPTIGRDEAIAFMRSRGLRHLPLVDAGWRLVDLLFLDDLTEVARLRNCAVIMAGGAGSRLRPLTETVPKPLLRVGGKPLLEIMIERLRGHGVSDFYLSVHYKSDMIEAHFGDGSRLGVSIRYLREDEPLGTAGALRLLGRWTEPLFLVNGDVLTRCDFGGMLAFHRRTGAHMTVGLVPYEVELPYGVFSLEGDRLTGLSEKPRLDFQVNSGLYVIGPELRELIPAHQVFDATDLIRLAVEAGRPVRAFPIADYWLDVGRHDDLGKADRDVAEGLLD
jgi:dTDP-glucose pyrophosphorylase